MQDGSAQVLLVPRESKEELEGAQQRPPEGRSTCILSGDETWLMGVGTGVGCSV